MSLFNFDEKPDPVIKAEFIFGFVVIGLVVLGCVLLAIFGTPAPNQ